jgi:hypothetical protein
MAVYSAMYNILALLQDVGAKSIEADYRTHLASIYFDENSEIAIHENKYEQDKVKIVLFSQGIIKSFVCNAINAPMMHEMLFGKTV